MSALVGSALAMRFTVLGASWFASMYSTVLRERMRLTVEYMLANQLAPNTVNLIANADPTSADMGFGLGVAVRTTPGVVRKVGSVGEFSWNGAYGTSWWADPKEQLAVVFMAQTPGPIRWHYRYVINALVEQAIVD